MHLRHLLPLLVFECLASLCAAQGKEEWKTAGTLALQAGKYEEALKDFSRYNDKWPSDAKVLANTGICYYHLNNIIEAENYLYQSFRAKDDPPPEAYYYLGKVNHAKLEFEIAVDFYKKYLRKTDRSHPFRASVKDDIQRCATGIKVRRAAPLAAVLNLGDLVNSTEDEFKPLLSPAGRDRLYFASNAAPNKAKTTSDCDIYSTDLENGDWQKPAPISHFINSIQEEVPLGFGEDGLLLYFFRGSNLSRGDILVDTFRENAVERTLLFSVLDSPVEPRQGDTAPFFFNDSVLLFASRRAGGFGGLDLYVSTKTKGRWAVPENLGPTINTAYDETSPFLANDGRTLYYSTNHPALSIGGFDIVKARYLDHLQQWSKPVNTGIPLNSAADDAHFLMTPKGDRAFFSSARKEGFGKRDLYVAIFEQPLGEQEKVSLPVAFPDVPAFQAAMGSATESDAADPAQILDGLTKLELRPMQYSPGEPFFVSTVRQLDLLAALLVKYPGAKLILAIHTAKPGGSPDLAHGILARLSSYFKAAGVPLENLNLRWAGDAYPLFENNLPKANRRIEAYIANPALLPFELAYPKTPDRAAPAVFFENAMQRHFYQVSIPVPENGSDAFLEALFAKYPEGMVTLRPGTASATFHLGVYLTYTSARQWQDEVASNGFPDAALTAWLRGWELSKNEAAQHVSEFPDLEYFIQN
ncbi:MAG: tetratricopeptide repeat protein [Saprospiraceae bacterium]